MVADICKMSHSRWDQLALDLLPPSEAESLSDHLAHCTSCRREFESHCAAAELWESSAQTLQEREAERVTATQTSASEAAVPPRERWLLTGLAPSNDGSSLGELDEFAIREVVGYGGMGTVLKAWDRKLCRIVAIKLMHPHLAANGPARHRFGREAQAAAAIAHPNVVPIHNVSSLGSLPYLVMAYIPGGSLQERLDQHGPFTLIESLRIAVQIAEGLDAAHAQGLVHRDIKPANILLEASRQRALITDFGLARALDDASLTASGMLAGTPQYMSPEQARGDDVDHRSDLFSLGSVLYIMLTGRAPFRGDSAVQVLRRVQEANPIPLAQVDEQLPPWTQRLIDRFLTLRVEERLQNAREAAQLLHEVIQHLQNPNLHTLPDQVTTPPRLRRAIPSLIAWLAIGFAILSLAGAIVTWANPSLLTSWSALPPDEQPQAQTLSSQNTVALGPEATTANTPIPDLLPPNVPVTSRDTLDIQLEELESDLWNLLNELQLKP